MPATADEPNGGKAGKSKRKTTVQAGLSRCVERRSAWVESIASL